MRVNRIKKSVDFTEEDLKNIEAFKENYRRCTGSTKISNAYVLGSLLSTFGNLSDETRKMIIQSLTNEVKKIQRNRQVLQDYGTAFDMHARKELRTIEELKNIIDFMSFGESISFKQEDELKEIKRIDTPKGYAKVPNDWIVIQPFENEETDSVYIIEMRNSSKLDLPHLVFSCKGDPYDNESQIYQSAMEAYPDFKNKVLDKQVEIKYDEEGRTINLEEWAEAPTIGFFRIEDADDDRSDDEYPYGAKFYRNIRS